MTVIHVSYEHVSLHGRTLMQPRGVCREISGHVQSKFELCAFLFPLGATGMGWCDLGMRLGGG